MQKVDRPILGFAAIQVVPYRRNQLRFAVGAHAGLELFEKLAAAVNGNKRLADVPDM